MAQLRIVVHDHPGHRAVPTVVLRWGEPRLLPGAPLPEDHEPLAARRADRPALPQGGPALGHPIEVSLTGGRKQRNSRAY